MDDSAIIVLLAAVGTALLGAAAALHGLRQHSHWAFLGAMVLLTAEGLFQYLSLRAGALEVMIFWQRIAMIPLMLVPLPWLMFSLTFARGDAGRFLRPWRLALPVAAILVTALVAGFPGRVVSGASWEESAATWVFGVSDVGKLLFGYLVTCSVLILANLEGTVRSAVGTARWKIKYTVVGLGLWCGAHVYTGTQVLLYSGRSLNLIHLDAAATLVASVSLAVAVFRSRLSGAEIYPSPAALHKSLSVILAGVYLAALGLVAKLTSLWGGAQNFPVVSVVVLVGLGGFGALCLSDRVRAAVRQFVSRHFERPVHDYRHVWTKFAHRTASSLDPQEYARQAVGVVSETFEALSVSLWLVDTGNGRLGLVASSSLDVRHAAQPAMDETAFRGLARVAGESLQPIDLNRCRESWCDALKAGNPVLFPSTGSELFCQPLGYGGELVGLVVVGDRVGGAPFTAEDLELLKCLGDQMAAGLRTLGLSGKLLQAREMEAFQMMSAFLVHDLKNTASALSLTLKNLPRHFDNPAFREDALRTLSRSVQRVNDLIGRLSSLRQHVDLRRAPTDLNQLVASARQLVGETPSCPIREQLGTLPRLSLDAPQIESVIVNLLLNAREAIPDSGEVSIETSAEGGEVNLTVADTGCGMTAEFIAHSLFKPFKTSKKTGLGIGMYQTKTIVEAHGGRITVRSEPGRGTTFRVSLPGAIAAI